MTKKNFVSVLLPVYNAEKFLPETLNSLMIQTHKDIEVIAVNDGSTDNSLEILKKYSKFDNRIIVIDQKNSGIVKTLNTAAKVASGEFLARIDADDLATPRRFERQVIELIENPECVLIASSFDVIDEESEFLYHDSVPTLESDIKTAMFYRNPIAHGSIMMRKSTFEKSGGYSSDCGPTEDYELWTRILKLGQVRVLPQALFRWRVNTKGITSTQSEKMKVFMDKNLNLYWKENEFNILSRLEILRKAKYYIQEDSKYGVARKEVMLHDLCKVSLKLIKQGRRLDGIRQLITVSSIGRSGFRIMRHTLKEPFDWHVKRRIKHYIRSFQ